MYIYNAHTGTALFFVNVSFIPVIPLSKEDKLKMNKVKQSKPTLSLISQILLLKKNIFY